VYKYENCSKIFSQVLNGFHYVLGTTKKKNVKQFRTFLATTFCVYKLIFQKYKGNSETGPFLLSFEAGWLNWLTFFPRLPDFCWCFRNHL
jgi:hypothetical protein